MWCNGNTSASQADNAGSIPVTCSIRQEPGVNVCSRLFLSILLIKPTGGKKMFQTASGVTIPFPEKIREQFQVFEGRAIRANISFEKLKPLITEFYRSLPEPLFFVLEIPLSISEERKFGSSGILHHEVCYLDGQTRDQMDSIFNSYGQILLEDGISQFAIASHFSHEEIFVLWGCMKGPGPLHI